MNVVEMAPKLDCHDLAKSLRNVADDIEAGRYDFDPTLAVLVLGRETERRDRDGVSISTDWQTHGLGKCGQLAAKGLLASALSRFDSQDMG